MALIDEREPLHSECVEAATRLPPTMLATLPVLTEAMHLLRALRAPRGQEALWAMVMTHVLHIAPIDDDALRRMATLMMKYRDAPMDFADASLVAVAEQRELTRIFTLDAHFRGYRIGDHGVFEVVP